MYCLNFAHFSDDKRDNYLKQFKQLLKRGDLITFEAFSKKQIDIQKDNPKSGGPKNAEMLFFKEELQTCSSGYEFEELITELSEGKFHQGKAAVICFVARKPFN